MFNVSLIKITTMKKNDFFWSLLAIMMAASMSISLLSCGDDDPDPELTVSPEKLEFGTGSDSKPVTITSNVGWTVVANKEWIEVNQPSGKDNGTIYVDVKDNKEFGEKRTGRVTITASEGGIVRTIEISQKSITAQLEINPTSVSPIKGEGGTINFNITSNLKWKVSSNQNWLKVDKNQGSGNDFITATAEPNGTSSSRTAMLTFEGLEGNPNAVTVNVSQEPGGISVSPTSASLLSDKGSTTNLTITASGSWNLTGIPEWLHASATSGVGNTNLTLTALTENWSDEERSAVLTFTASTLSTSCIVSQRPSLPSGLRVETSNMTLMSDGFACDLTFGSESKGYREAFFTESAYLTMTDRDIYNELMKQEEYNKVADFACYPGFVDPGTTLIYCVASYGNDNNADGTHKYGPITIKRITTLQETIEDDMYLTSSYTSTQWKVTADRKGKYGQRCDEYYYLAAENDFAETLCLYYKYVTYAYIAHLYFKPMIESSPNSNYKYGPQTMSWSREGDKFFCITWGIDRNTKAFSADLSDPVYRDLSSSSARQMERKKLNQADLNNLHWRPSSAEINKIRNAIRVYKAK